MPRGGKRPGSGRKKGSTKEKKKKMISIRMNIDLLSKIDNIAENRTRFIEKACEKKIMDSEITKLVDDNFSDLLL